MEELISIIMPAYNAGLFIKEAINSVLRQSYANWELIIINDGSTDETEKIVKAFQEKRIRYFNQLNKGVSAARNVGLSKMNGEYFCFLDADDVLPSESLRSRFEIFKINSSLEFVDGVVDKKDQELGETIGGFIPKLMDKNPLKDLVSLNGGCFFGLSWMIKRKENKQYSFWEELAHAEDLFFFMELARKGGTYAFTTEVVYQYRNHPGSAMKNLEGLELGYNQVYEKIKNWSEVSKSCLFTYQLRVKKIMFLSYFRTGNLLRAIKVLV